VRLAPFSHHAAVRRSLSAPVLAALAALASCSSSEPDLMVPRTHPDLIVTWTQVSPGAHWDHDLEVRWTVRNVGSATTSGAGWTDRLSIAQDQGGGGEITLAPDVQVQGSVAEQAETTLAATRQLPEQRPGALWYVHVQTDVANQQQEAAGEGNNGRFSLAIAIGDSSLAACDNPGNICTWAGTGAAGFDGDGHTLLQSEFYWPIDLTRTSTGEWYILDWNNHRVRHVTSQGTLETVIGGSLGDGPEIPNDRAEFSPPGWPGELVNLNHPTHLCELQNGSILLSAWQNNKLRRYDPSTGLVTVICGDTPGFAGDGGPASAALLNEPIQSVQAVDGSIYCLDMRNQRVRRIDPNGTISTVVGTGVGGFDGDGGPPLQALLNLPFGPAAAPGGALALDADGRLYISDTLNNRIRRVDFTLNRIETIAGTGTAGYSGDSGPAVAATLRNPRDLAYFQGRLYVADELNDAVRVIDLATGVITTAVGPTSQTSLYRPAGLEVDANGRLYIADTFHHRILVMHP
jgi:hypothetical protein